MSISLPQDTTRRTATETKDRTSRELPEKRFRELMQTHPTDEKPQGKKEKADGTETLMIDSPLIFSSPLASSIAIKPMLGTDLDAIFEKIASCMVLMTSSADVETTMIMDKPGSLFFGTEITIREFSTAPKAFNVEIRSLAQAIQAIEANRNALLSLFERGNFNFSVHRLETFIQNEEKPVLHRKESSDQEHKGGGEE
jgi:hypothetical protein